MKPISDKKLPVTSRFAKMWLDNLTSTNIRQRLWANGILILNLHKALLVGSLTETALQFDN